MLKPWAQQGNLPTLRRLLEEGAAGELQSTIPPMTAPAWTSFMTGKNPGKHGLYDWIERRPESYQVSAVTASRCQEPSLWELLGRHGRRVCVLNVPMTFPPRPVNGLMLSGMPAPSKKVPIDYPPGLLAEIEKEVGEYLLYPDPGQAYSDSGVDAFLDRLYRTTETRLKVISHLRAREDWDFFMVVFNGTDTVQHAMWKYMDSAHPLHDPSRSAIYGRAILDYYRYVDGALGALLGGLDDDTVLMIMSDHGFGPFHKFIYVNNWLREQGWLRLRGGARARLKTALFDAGFSPMSVYDLLMRFGWGRLKREVVRGKGQGLLRALFLSFDDVDWRRTQAYSLGNVGQIRLNVLGREPQGAVEPGERYEALRDEIISRLWQLRDPQTGERVVQEVYRREEIYSGKNLEQAADIVFIPTRLEYFGFGEYEFGSHRLIEAVKRGISGTHRPNGVFLLWGKPVRPGVWLEGARIYDLAPTVLHLMGCPLPGDMDGRVLGEGLREAYRGPSPQLAETEAQAATAGPPPEGGELSQEDERLLAERLRNLGYVG